jgi:hypothetical protein
VFPCDFMDATRLIRLTIKRMAQRYRPYRPIPIPIHQSPEMDAQSQMSHMELASHSREFLSR